MANISPTKIEPFHVLWTYAQNTLHKAWTLFCSNFYKITEFQLLFKLIYLSIVFWGIAKIINIAEDLITKFTSHIAISEILQQTKFFSSHQLQALTILLIWIMIILYIYLIERTGITYMSERYYRNLPVSFFHTLRVALTRTPRVVFAKFYERRIPILLIIGLYLLRVLFGLFDIAPEFQSILLTMLSIGIILIILTLIFLNGFTIHVACLDHKESALRFKKTLPWSFNQRRYFTLTVFYAGITTFVLFMVALYWVIIKTLSVISTPPEFTSTILSFLISFTFFMILVVWSLIRTARTDITTILYIDARKILHRPIPEVHVAPQHKRRHAQKPLTGIFLLCVFILIMSIITMTPVESSVTNIFEFLKSVASYNETLEIYEQERISLLESLLSGLKDWLKGLFN